MLTPSSSKALEASQTTNNDISPLPPYYVNVNDFKRDDAVLGAEYQTALFARCARGDHQVERKYGVFGIIVAAVLFPIGLICLYVDSHKRCSRCGVVIPRR